MRFLLTICCLLCALCFAPGCASVKQPCPIPYENPVLVPPVNRDFLWDQLVDVVDDYFEIEREDRVRLVDNVLTLGRIDTVPELSATLLEPWKRDSVGYYQRLESTLQTMRRQATVQVVPTENGYLVDVTVFKYLEDLRRPEQASAAGSNFRNDESLDRYNDQTQGPSTLIDSFPIYTRAQGPIGPQPYTSGWIQMGRDTLLEQKIITKLLGRVNPGALPGANCQAPPANCETPPLIVPTR